MAWAWHNGLATVARTTRETCTTACRRLARRLTRTQLREFARRRAIEPRGATSRVAVTSAQRDARIVLKDNLYLPKHNIPQAIGLLILSEAGSLSMSKKIETVVISRRRAFWILGAGMALGVGTPAAVLTASDAEAQTTGMERRQDRREDRRDRRQDRRTDRQDRRQERRTGVPATGSPASTTGQAPAR